MKTFESLLERFTDEARKARGTVVFPEGDEERTLEAAVRLSKDGVCSCAVVARDRGEIEKTAGRKGLDLSGLTVVVPSAASLDESVREEFVRRIVARGSAEEEARQRLLDPLYFGALYVKSGNADGYVAGARSETAGVIRALIYGMGISPGMKTVSSFFLMVPPPEHPLIDRPLLFADCAVNPEPDAVGLRDIAVAAVGNFKRLFPGEEPRAAFLSFSTRGSAEHPSLAKIRAAVARTKEVFKSDPSVRIDGELQVDAALLPSVAERKLPGSPVGGKANILIFPDLNSGNICYKLVERLGGFRAVGPLIQGVQNPASDLSRGCSAEDIYYAAVFTLLRKK